MKMLLMMVLGIIAALCSPDPSYSQESSSAQFYELESIVRFGCATIDHKGLRNLCREDGESFAKTLLNPDVKIFDKNRAGLILKTCTVPTNANYGRLFKMRRYYCFYEAVQRANSPTLKQLFTNSYNQGLLAPIKKPVDLNLGDAGPAQDHFFNSFYKDLAEYADPNN